MNNIIVLGFVSLLTDISTEMIYPILPLYLTSVLGATPSIVGIIEGIAESIASLLKFYSGYIVDKYQHKKRITFLGYGMSVINKLVLLIASTWAWILLARIIDRFGKGIRTAPRDVIIAESAGTGGMGKAFGLHRAFDTLGAVIGVSIAYYFIAQSNYNFMKIFAISIIPALLGVCVISLVKEKNNEVKDTKTFSFKWDALDTRLKAFLIISFIFTLGNSSNQFLLLRASNTGFDAKTVILLYLLYNLVYSLFSYPLGRLSDKVGRRNVIVTGYLFYGLVYLGFGYFSSKVSIVLLFALYGLYIASTQGVERALIADISPSELKGTVLGLHSALVGVGLLPASILAGLLWDAFGVSVPFYFGGVIGIITSISIFIILRQSTQKGV